MATLAAHHHEFDESTWPFAEPVNTAAFTTTKVLREGHPILRVAHDQDGDWQILCGTTTDPKDCLVICLGCAFKRDRSIGEVADLPLGWLAERKSASARWWRARI